MLGPSQTQIITTAAASCAKALKQITSSPLKAQVKKALSGRKHPEEVYALLNEVALKASVKSRMSTAAKTALENAADTLAERIVPKLVK